MKNEFLTAGEDGLINLWNFDGELIKKYYQNAPVWSVAYMEDSNAIISGCADSGVAVIPLKYSINKKINQILSHRSIKHRNLLVF